MPHGPTSQSTKQSKIYFFLVFVILPWSTEQNKRIYCFGFLFIILRGVQATLHGNISVSSIMRNSAHFSPRFCASALFFLRMIRGMRKGASVMSKLVITTLSGEEDLQLQTCNKDIFTWSYSCFRSRKFLAADSKMSSFPKDQRRSQLGDIFIH